MTTPPNITDLKLLRDATERITGSRFYGSTDRFVHMAVESLLRSSGDVRILRKEWDDEGDGAIVGYTVYVREPPSDLCRASCGDTLAEALANTIMTEEVIDL